ncbi:MAG: GGDEF domain-containing phosphodiesterase [Glaciecola sp.]
MSHTYMDNNNYTDSLTQLLNRAGLEHELAQYDINAKHDLKTAFTVQISKFGQINTGLGSNSANKVIVKIAKRLKSLFPYAIIIARTHGDHFFVAFNDDHVVEEQLEKLLDFTQRPLIVMGKVMVLSVKVGYVGKTIQPPNYLSFLHASEIAVDQAKRLQILSCEYSPELQQAAIDSHELENTLRVSLVQRHFELHNAQVNDEFFLQYQPIVNIHSGKVEYFEALLRWQHPLDGNISPAVFIPVAEQIQAIDVLGIWVMGRAIADAKQWNATAQGKGVGVSINVSPLQFDKPDILLGALSKALEINDFSPELVKIEITETSAFSENLADALNQLKQVGCEIALDDFGTGYSSLTQINALPLEYLKLDRSFIKDLTGTEKATENASFRLTEGILNIASTFNLTSVVEGVETAEQLTLLKDMGAQLIQGYYFSKPLPVEQVSGYLLNNNIKVNL